MWVYMNEKCAITSNKHYNYNYNYIAIPIHSPQSDSIPFSFGILFQSIPILIFTSILFHSHFQSNPLPFHSIPFSFLLIVISISIAISIPIPLQCILIPIPFAIQYPFHSQFCSILILTFITIHILVPIPVHSPFHFHSTFISFHFISPLPSPPLPSPLLSSPLFISFHSYSISTPIQSAN